MKKFGFIWFVGIFIILNQNTYGQYNFVGLKGGIGFTKEINNLYKVYSKPGFLISGNYTHNLNDKISARIEGGFTQKGFRSKVHFPGPGINDDEVYQTTYNYISVGPDIIIAFPKPKKTVYLLSGIRTDYLINYTTEDDNYKQVMEDFRHLQLLLNAGAGLIFPSGIFLEINGSIDFLNKIKTTERTNSGPRIYDIYFGLSVGYELGL